MHDPSEARPVAAAGHRAQEPGRARRPASATPAGGTLGPTAAGAVQPSGICCYESGP